MTFELAMSQLYVSCSALMRNVDGTRWTDIYIYSPVVQLGGLGPIHPIIVTRKHYWMVHEFL